MRLILENILNIIYRRLIFENDCRYICYIWNIIYVTYNMFNIFLYCLISDFIPKKSEKVEFWKIFGRMGYPPEKLKILKKIFFHQNKCKIVIACSSFEKVLNSWIESYEAYSIFRTSAILEVVIFENSSFLNFLRIKSETNHSTFLNNYFVLRSPINLTWCFWQNTR